LDLSKLISLVSTRAAAGIAATVVVAGAGSAVALSTTPTSSHQHQTVISVGDSTANPSPEATESPDGDSTSSGSSTTNHGDVVTQAVSSCKSSAAQAGTHGIGDCVSDVASGTGQAHRHTTSESSHSSGG
jgi:hypothetical protein